LKSNCPYTIHRLDTEGPHIEVDTIAVEEPLEIIVSYGSPRKRKTLAVTMRTPDDDTHLALGFLYTEGIISSKKEVANMRFLEENSLLVDLHENVNFDIEKLNRHFYTTSSCGVCGKASLEAVSTQSCYILNKNFPLISKNILFKINTQIIDNQPLFKQTGGTHASALFDLSEANFDFKYIKTMEDVGRHNALDKIIGYALKNDMLPLSNHLLVVSGRASFELIQKALMAGIPIVAAVGAPSSLAVDLAVENNMTLIGFLKKNTLNVYSGFERIFN
jgi:FdhD protein